MELTLADLLLTTDATDCRPIEGGFLLSAPRLTVDLPAAPQRYLYSGWQSWSLTAWVETSRPVEVLRPRLLHPMQTDPRYVQDRRPNGSWYGAVELPAGKIVFLGALGLESHVCLEQQRLHGWYEQAPAQGASQDWFLAAGEEEAIFSRYAELLGERLGKVQAEHAPRVWCSWYSLYTEISEPRLLKILNDLDSLPFDVFQIDDGWQRRIGDWEANEKFPSGMAWIANRIQETGRKAGLWLAPLLVVPSSAIYRDHRDWLLHDENGRLVSAGYNWREPLFALDTTHPAALEWLAGLMKKVRTWGYEYVKLDFLYAGALPGKRYADVPRETAYRQGLAIIRQALGNAYFLTCGAPILPSLGLCDAMRVGPDVADHWASPRDDDLLRNFAAPGIRNALRTTLHRLWLAPLVRPDPDVVYFHAQPGGATAEQRGLLQAMAEICGFKATSDLPCWLTEAERAALAAFLENKLPVRKTGRTRYAIGDQEVDFASCVALPPSPSGWTKMTGAMAGQLANLPLVLNLFDALWKADLRKKLNATLGV
jgi:alpha-galactosidase